MITLYLVLISLFVAAFLMPQIIFRIQDRILCKDVTLGQRESMDVEALSISYEKSLAARMTGFAEGLAGNDSFYVTSQELEISREVTDFLYSESGLNQDMVTAFMEGGLLPYEIWKGDYEIQQWKRYVIYSDDYAKGVNYILWYIELQDVDDSVFKLLTDAEDGTIYGLRTEDSHKMLKWDATDYLRDFYIDDYILTQLWGFYAVYYEAISEDAANTLYTWMEEYGWSDINEFLDAEVRTEGEGRPEIPGVSLENAGYDRDGKNRVLFRMPYHNTWLDFMMEMEYPEVQPNYRYLYPDLTIGVRQIYEMIPEFA